jgi:hypothetical protein
MQWVCFIAVDEIEHGIARIEDVAITVAVFY